MPRRKTIFVGTRFPLKTSRVPIRLQPNPTRPIRLHQKNLLRGQFIQQDLYYFTLHRRGPRRLAVGQDPNEARAVPKSQIKGTLEERIVWLWLTDHHVQFSFQTSLLGGRLELGGLVADFILPEYMYVLNPAGPTHSQFGQEHKDEQQSEYLAEFGYRQFIIPQEDVLNEMKWEEVIRSILGLGPGGGGGSDGGGENIAGTLSFEVLHQLDFLSDKADMALSKINNVLAGRATT